MHCPVDSTVLVMSERSGVEIDYCPQCRGVWLDRGELDKILDRAAEQSPSPTPPQGRSPFPDFMTGYDRGDDDRRSGDYRSYGSDGYKRRKKDSWLSELFD